MALGQPGLVQQTAQIAAARDLTLFVRPRPVIAEARPAKYQQSALHRL